MHCKETLDIKYLNLLSRFEINREALSSDISNEGYRGIICFHYAGEAAELTSQTVQQQKLIKSREKNAFELKNHF